MIPGRVFVVALVYVVLGLAAIVLGLGPVLQPAGDTERVLAVVAIAAGSLLAAIGVSLLMRRERGKRLGMLGGAVLIMLGVLVMILAGVGLDGCPQTDESGCTKLVLTVTGGGLAISCLGIMSIVALRRLRPPAWADRPGSRRH